jgi:hypothetical protein
MQEVFQMHIKKYFIFYLVLTLCLSAVAIQASATETYYTVTFDSNGGSPVAQQKVLAGEKAVMPEQPTFSGHSFLYWQNLSWENGSGLYAFNDAIFEDNTLTAKWLKNDDWASPYSDVPYVVCIGSSGYFFMLNPEYEVVKWATVNNIVYGVTATTFAPNAKLTRAMLVTMLYRYDKPAKTESTTNFVDVSETAWYADSVAWASANGIVYGIDSQHFAPNKILDMEEMLVFLYRYALYKGMASSFVNEVQFANDDAISPWARAAYKKVASKYGLGYAYISGVGELSGANPKHQVTRSVACRSLKIFDEDGR